MLKSMQYRETGSKRKVPQERHKLLQKSMEERLHPIKGRLGGSLRQFGNDESAVSEAFKGKR